MVFPLPLVGQRTSRTRRIASPSNSNEQHSDILDGLRGIAAASVIFSHVFMLYFSEMHDGRADGGASALALGIFHSPFTFFYRGGAAVLLFFLLSGYVLYSACLRKAPRDDTYVPAAASKRYLRLGLPVAASVFVGYLGIALNFFPSAPKGNNAFLDFPDAGLGFMQMLQSALYSSMLFGDGRFSYVLWTISIEFYGSLLIFALYALMGKNKAVSAALCVGAGCYLLFLPKALSVYSLFLFGAALAHVDFRPLRQCRRGHRMALSAALLVIGCYLAGFHANSASYGVLASAAEAWQSLAPKADGSVIFPAIGALCILTAVLTGMGSSTAESDNTESGVGRQTLAWMGKLSFSVYLLHPFVLAGVGNYLFLEMGGTPQSLLLCLMLVFCLTYALSYLFYLYVDKPSMSIADRFGKRLFPSCATNRMSRPVYAHRAA